jgi:uncharacterized damage-inducible protein DinB
MTDLRYPIGDFIAPQSFSAQDRASWIAAIAALPAGARAAVAGLSETQLNTPYRDGGWTVRQVVHHMGDSHIVAFTRMKFALTEENPVAKGYDERLWAQLPDYVSTPLEVSLTLLDALHARWVRVLEGLSEAQFQRTFQHSALGPVRLDEQLAHYAWHSRHHVAHIASLRDRMGW